jgi:hypothetical protein
MFLQNSAAAPLQDSIAADAGLMRRRARSIFYGAAESLSTDEKNHVKILENI